MRQGAAAGAGGTWNLSESGLLWAKGEFGRHQGRLAADLGMQQPRDRREPTSALVSLPRQPGRPGPLESLDDWRSIAARPAHYLTAQLLPPPSAHGQNGAA